MNEFEKNVQSKNNDVVDSMKGFAFSFIFFILIFAIGVTVSVIGQ
ncbi:YqzM family protein [Virgibacillus halodenitrificans]|uniref:YqzM family protein n=1 Tax=Virgibacillus halodenitrificans TaxID=1482 RepID=A0ABR7VPU8_VIRHA|nr:YqzM family protein [Virgibacillus halodenitrificans]MBD1222858.1 YqzM family protein [Virgibacillus halodenitrificans]MCG1029994.1 YqzM family protein [Virgibacillus halodenitrificans]MCJ0930804.1 YqzM family protein [Virgibacillus halodenitrificans]MEC2160036.1 YqzM family protein [Virgibacillus halodenitrificans]MYL46638.1 YqzM family protein [Virgibacillus halodenitrificans]